MKRVIPYICLSAILASPAVCAGSQRLETYLPENTAFLTSVRDMTEINAKCRESTLKSLLDNDELAEFFKPIKMRFEDELENNKDEQIITWDEAKGHFNGQALIALDMDASVQALNRGDDSGPVYPSMLLLANMKDGEALVDLILTRIKDMPKEDNKFEIQEDETFLGVTIHHVTFTDGGDNADAGDKEAAAPWKAPKEFKGDAYAKQQYDDYDEDDNYYDESDGPEEETEKTPEITHLYFGVAQDTLFASNNQESARHVVEAIDGDAKGTFGRTAEWNDLRQTSEDTDFYAFVSFKPVATVIEALIRKNVPPVQAEIPNPMAPNSDMILNALGLGSINSLLLGVEFKPEYVHFKANYKMNTSYGIGRLFQSIGDSYPKPDFVPEEPLSVSSAGVNPGVIIRELRQIVFNAYPAAGMYYQMYTAQVQQQGVNLDSDLIDNFDNGIVIFSINKDVSVKTPPQNLIAIKIKDPVAMKRAIDAIINATGMQERVQRRDYIGTELILLPGSDPSSPSMTIAIKDGWLMLSPEITYIQNALSTNNSNKSFWTSDKFRSVDTAVHGANGFSVAYTNIGAFLRMFLEAFTTGYNDSTMQTDDNPDHLLKPDSISEIGEIPLLIGAKGYKTPDGFVQESFLISTED
ncbi:MAG: hypothetical protein WC360_01615 [Opitutales bacterium]|jgi:hypothetical protein